MIYQNFRGDFPIVERFYRTDDTGQKVRVAVPERVTVSYFTPGGPAVFTAERQGCAFKNCELITDPDGNEALLVRVLLSEVFLGAGPLSAIVTEYVADSGYPSGYRTVPIPKSTGVSLYPGRSDDSGEVSSIVELSNMLRGYSAYEIAVKHGFAGSEEDFARQFSVNAEAIANLEQELIKDEEVIAAAFASHEKKIAAAADLAADASDHARSIGENISHLSELIAANSNNINSLTNKVDAIGVDPLVWKYLCNPLCLPYDEDERYSEGVVIEDYGYELLDYIDVKFLWSEVEIHFL